MVVGKRNCDEKSIQNDSNKLIELIGEMAERFKAVDCKSIEFSHRRFESYFLLFLFSTKYGAAGSAPALGAGGHVFKSHYFETVFFRVNA